MASMLGLRPNGRSTSTGSGSSGPGHRHRTLRRLLAVGTSAALALGVAAPSAFAATLNITTPYPSVTVAPGANVAFDVEVSTDTAQRVALDLTGAPDSWSASIHGGGFVINAVETNGTDPATVRVDVDVPADATGSATMTLTAEAAGLTDTLVLEVTVEADATGDVTLTTDFPSLRGPSSQAFNFNLTLRNDTAEDLTFSVNAQAPAGWAVEANLTGQAQAASAIIKASSTSGVTVTATPPEGAPAGTYDIAVVAIVGDRQVTGSLQVEVTGTYTLSVATADGVLNGRGGAGSATPLTIYVTNSGTAPVSNVKVTATAPSGWEVTFDTPDIASIEPGPDNFATVVAQIKPSSDAIAGDYNITFTAAGDESTRDTMEVRWTVETSILWGVIGIALIVAVGAGIWFVFQRYGRR